MYKQQQKKNTQLAYKDTSGLKVQSFRNMCKHVGLNKAVDQENLIYFLVYNALHEKSKDNKKVIFDPNHYEKMMKKLEEGIENLQEMLLSNLNVLGGVAMCEELQAIH